MREQHVEPAADLRRLRLVIERQQAAQRAPAHRLGHVRFVLPVAAQVKALAVQHQRLVVVRAMGRPDLRAAEQQRAPRRRGFRPVADGRAQIAPLVAAPAQ
ncbi:hypothetical protein [Duganella sp. P38]|uniref:hypothetical protein n=1 Tax=Duganella sp. P38 TaxID=3423949 RepID=UPI003D7B0E5A